MAPSGILYQSWVVALLLSELVTTQAYSGDGLLPSSELEERSLVGAQSTAERSEPFDMSQIQRLRSIDWNSASAQAEASSVLMALQTYQQQKHGDVRDERLRLARSIIDSITKQGTEFQGKKMKIISDSQDLKSKIKALGEQVEASVSSYESSMGNLKDQVAATKTEEGETVERLRTKMLAFFDNILQSVMKKVERVMGEENPVTALVADQEAASKEKIDKIKESIEEMNEDGASQEKELKELVQSDTEKIKSKLDGFDNAMSGHEEQLLKLKDAIDENTGATVELESELKDEVAQRKEAIADVLSTAKDDDKDMSEEIRNDLIQPAEREFKDSAAKAAAKSGDYVTQINAAKEELKEKHEAALEDLTNTVEGYTQNIGSSLDSTNAQLQALSSRIIQMADAQKGFPKSAEKKISRLEVEAANGFNDVRAKGQEFVKSLTDQYLEKAQSSTQAAESEMATKLDEYVAADREQASKIVKDARDTASKTVDTLFGYKSNIEQSQEEISGLNQQFKTYSSKVARLEKEQTKADVAISSKLEAQKQYVEKNAEAMVTAARKELARVKKKGQSTYDKALTKVHAAQAKIEAGMNKEGTKVLEELEKELSEALKLQSTLNSTSDNGLRKMDSLIKEIKTEIYAISQGVAEADADAKGFEESAKQGIQIVDTDAGYALTDAQNLVDTYVNDMKATQTAKVGEFRKAVNDAMQRVLTKFQSGKEKFSSNYLTLQRKNTNDVQTADSKILAADQLVKENKADVEQMKTDIGEAFSQAKLGIGSQESGFKEKIAEQEQQLTDTEAKLSQYVTSTASSVSTKAQEGMDSVKKKLEKLVTDTRTAVDTQTSKLGFVETDAEALNTKAAGLHAKVTNVKEALNAAKLQQQEIASSATSEMDSLAGLVKGLKDADSQSAADMSAEFREKEADADKQINDMIAKSEDGFKGTMSSARNAMTGEADRAESTVANQDARAQSEIDALEGKVSAELDGASSHVSDVTAEMKAEQERIAAADEKIEAETAKIRAASNLKSEEFGSQMGALGQQLGAELGAGHKDIGAIQEKLATLTEDTRTALSTQADSDWSTLQGLIGDARAKMNTIRGRVDTIQRKADAFADQIAAVSSSASSSVGAAAGLNTAFDNSLSGARSQGMTALSEERFARQKATGKLIADLKKDMSAFSRLMTNLDDISQDTLQGDFAHKVAELNMGQSRMRRGLTNALGLEKYQDEEALTAVETKVEEGTKKEQEITDWKANTTKEATDFEKFVVEEFQKLGVVLDLSELDMARAKAEENWAIQEEMRRMKAKLQGEVGEVSAVAEARLADLAASNGRAIADLLRNEKLTEAERAARLEQIRKEAREGASRIMESDAKMALDQKMTERKIKLASNDVEQFMGRVASLEGPGPSASALGSVLARVRDLIHEANGEASSLAQTGTTASLTQVQEAEAEEGAGSRFLRSAADPGAMLEVATNESECMRAEDEDWRKELAEMNAALDKQDRKKGSQNATAKATSLISLRHPPDRKSLSGN